MERITKDLPASDRLGHEFRYHLAAGFCSPEDTVLDAACGTGYGSHILSRFAFGYVGVDLFKSDELADNTVYINANLLTWQPNFDFDVFVGFETIEHLSDYTNYVKIAKQARKWIIVSCPVIPTKHMNPYHLQDFEPGALFYIFSDKNWEHYQSVQQPSEFSEISVFKRR